MTVVRVADVTSVPCYRASRTRLSLQVRSDEARMVPSLETGRSFNSSGEFFPNVDPFVPAAIASHTASAALGELLYVSNFVSSLHQQSLALTSIDGPSDPFASIATRIKAPLCQLRCLSSACLVDSS